MNHKEGGKRLAVLPRVHPRVRVHGGYGGGADRVPTVVRNHALDARRVHRVTDAPHELEAVRKHERVHLVEAVRRERDAVGRVQVSEARHREVELARVEVPGAPARNPRSTHTQGQVT